MPYEGLTDCDHDLLFGEDALEPGDAVVHLEHGLARYAGQMTCELCETPQTLTTFVYRNGGKLMLPAVGGEDFWRFGAPADQVTLDRLKAGDWIKRRDEMIAELRESADHMVKDDEARRSVKATPLQPKKVACQSRAIWPTVIQCACGRARAPTAIGADGKPLPPPPDRTTIRS